MLGARMFEDDNWDDASCLCTRWFTCGSVSVGVGSWGRSWWELGTVGGETRIFLPKGPLSELLQNWL